MRTNLRHLALCALGALAACTFNRIDGAIEIDVTGVPEDAVRAEAVVTDSTNATTKREPHFGTGVYLGQTLVLTFPQIPAGPFTVQITAYDVDSTPLAVGNGMGNYTVNDDPDAPLPVVSVQLTSNGLPGTYGAACIVTGADAGPNACSGGLVCEQYGSDQGFCTHSCNGNATCESVPPGATCEAFEGVAANTVCQWECGADGGSCPPGLSCGSAIATSGGKRFCTGSP